MSTCGPNPGVEAQENLSNAVSGPIEPPFHARFVRDTTIFDGTEMAPGTPFTKIWTVRNDGAHVWPEGIKLQCVGGDDLQSCHRVELELEGKVAIGAEVQLAVDLIAPQRAGRYVGYFRLVSPSGKKFGQRLWCTLNVIDDVNVSVQSTARDENRTNAATDEVPAKAASDQIQAEAALSADASAAAVSVVTPRADTATFHDVAADATLTVLHTDQLEATRDSNTSTPEAAMTGALTPAASVPPSAEAVADADSDDAFVPKQKAELEELEALEASSQLANEKSSSEWSDTVVISAGEQVIASLEAMGFTDPELNVAVIEREHGNVEACAGTLLALSEWSTALADLKVMGFDDVRRNVDLLLTHNGDIRLAVKELIST